MRRVQCRSWQCLAELRGLLEAANCVVAGTWFLVLLLQADTALDFIIAQVWTQCLSMFFFFFFQDEDSRAGLLIRRQNVVPNHVAFGSSEQSCRSKDSIFSPHSMAADIGRQCFRHTVRATVTDGAPHPTHPTAWRLPLHIPCGTIRMPTAIPQHHISLFGMPLV